MWALIMIKITGLSHRNSHTYPLLAPAGRGPSVSGPPYHCRPFKTWGKHWFWFRKNFVWVLRHPGRKFALNRNLIWKKVHFLGHPKVKVKGLVKVIRLKNIFCSYRYFRELIVSHLMNKLYYIHISSLKLIIGAIHCLSVFGTKCPLFKIPLFR